MNSFWKNRNRLGLLILWLAASLATAPARAQSSGPQYVVQEGDTLYSIAQSFGVSIDSLQQANNITDPSLLAIGQRLVIPGFEGVNGTLATYRVRLGETLPGLAKRFGADAGTLIRLNRLTRSDSLYVGQPLIYPDTGGGIPSGRTVVMANDPLIALAARSGQSPWALSLVNDLQSPLSAFTGQPIVIPDDSDSAKPLTGLPQPFESLALSPDRPIQGGAVELDVHANGGVTLNGQFGPWLLRFSPDPNDPTRLIALQGIHVFTEPALYPLTLTAATPDGATTSFEQWVAVASGDYPFQQLVVGPDQSALLDPNIVGPEREMVLQTVSTYTPTRQWDGLFVKPVPSERITTGFGWRRSYNGGPYDSYHDGIDYGSPGGTAIIAPANGTVVFAGPLQVRGNTTIIDHGWGVYTGYWHQYQIYVTVGQVVKQGEAIGEVGSSGLSTGSHLHYTMWVGGNAVNPEEWFTTAFP
ncbi:MAG: LysM peptidoglycan-binding domain-containing protein [Chloroflexi bacterium]|nr:LysM peptidoglycan-binding domain-containing protein [Chloroflexota bacterium]